jgi:alkanesulfonate monooxygenase SsuD/methylene tetrahydromethanopterin reductase-like flavin-dependent oxidoreductase (luciferase family)
MSVSFGLTIPQRGAFIGVGTIGELLTLGPIAEQSGQFDSVWVGDSLIAKPRPESISLLGALTAMTEDIGLGVACMASFTVRDPVTFAYQWATLDQLSEGRMLLAACTGIVPNGGASAREGEHFGGLKDADRPAVLEENIRLCRELWRGEPVDFDGRFRSYNGVQIQPTPVQDPCPIWISANPNPGKYFARSMKRVATLADGFQTVVMAPDSMRTMTTELRIHLTDAGRDADTFPRMAYHNINIGSNRDDCLRESKRFLDEYYGPVFPMHAVESWTAAGTPDECVEHLLDLVDQGANAITFRCTSWNQRDQIERLTKEVLPALA